MINDVIGHISQSGSRLGSVKSIKGGTFEQNHHEMTANTQNVKAQAGFEEDS